MARDPSARRDDSHLKKIVYDPSRKEIRSHTETRFAYARPRFAEVLHQFFSIEAFCKGLCRQQSQTRQYSASDLCLDSYKASSLFS